MPPRHRTLPSLDDARTLIQNRFTFTPRVRSVPVQDAYGKTTAEAIISPVSIPSAHRSAVAGMAVKSRDTTGATRKNPIQVTDYCRVNTGNVIDERFDAVIRIEDGEEGEEGYLIRTPARPWQHIRPIGEEITATEMILPCLSRIRAEEIGALVQFGIHEIPVLDLRVALILTGSGITTAGQEGAGGIHMAAAFLTDAGISAPISPVPAEQGMIRAAIKEAAIDHDLILISAGSSHEATDMIAAIIADLGSVIVRGLAIKPGKRVIVGDINSRPVIGLPGYPIACHTVLREILRPVLEWYGFNMPEHAEITARLAGTIPSSPGTDQFVLVTVGKVRNAWIAVPLSYGPGIQMNLVRSNACLKIPADQKAGTIGREVHAVLTVPEQEAEQMVLITGSHDPSIDYLADLVRKQGIRIASAHVGSMDGLLALKRGDCHLAPMHLLAGNGEYNIPYLQKYFPDEELVLICVGERMQGMVSREILGFDDITRYRFINRQQGSGTRMLLDYLLEQKRISPDQVDGYHTEVTSHLAVCQAVKSGDADLGMTVYGAALSLSLPFIEVGVERYELVTTKRLFEHDPHIRTIAEIIASRRYQEVLIHLGGYETGETGTIRYCNQKTAAKRKS